MNKDYCWYAATDKDGLKRIAVNEALLVILIECLQTAIHKKEIADSQKNVEGAFDKTRNLNEPTTGIEIEPFKSTKPLAVQEYSKFPFKKIKDLRQFCRRNDRLFSLQRDFDRMVKEANEFERFVAIDIEAWEQNQRKLTEIGICTFERKHGGHSHTRHFIIREHKKLKNVKMAKGARDSFEFGSSQLVTLKEALEAVQHELEQPKTALIGHCIISDILFIQRATLTKSCAFIRKSLCQSDFLNKIPSFDTQLMWRSWMGVERHLRLVDLCELMGVGECRMHNAGNDAAATMAVFLQLLKCSR